MLAVVTKALMVRRAVCAMVFAVVALAPVFSLAQVMQFDRSDIAVGTMPCHAAVDPAQSDQVRHPPDDCVCTPWCAFAAANIATEPFAFEHLSAERRTAPDMSVRQVGVEPPLEPPRS